MGKFDGILICTDLDGTLLKNDKTISDTNIDAIEYFKQNGGLFTFVTGRMPYYVSYITEKVRPNAPFGCVNGGGIYDFNHKYLWTRELSKEVMKLVKCIDDKFPTVGIQVCTFEKTYFCKENDTMKRFRKDTLLENHICHYEDVKEPVGKIIFGSESNDEIFEIEETLNNHELKDEFEFIRSSRSLFEILPKGICKGTSIQKLCEILGIDSNKTIALGDYNNDISMFHSAKIGIAVSNACKEALNAADFITVSNEEHAIAKVICDLENGKYI